MAFYFENTFIEGACLERLFDNVVCRAYNCSRQGNRRSARPSKRVDNFFILSVLAGGHYGRSNLSEEADLASWME
jgi:hypothetical protein